MKQTYYSVKISTHDKITTLKCLQGFLEIVGFAPKKGNSRTFKHHYWKFTFFQGFQGLEKAEVNFKYFQALQGPVRTLSNTRSFIMNGLFTGEFMYDIHILYEITTCIITYIILAMW